MSHAAGITLVRQALNTFTRVELRHALSVELQNFDFNDNRPSEEHSKSAIVDCVLHALDAKGPDHTFSALSKIHCWSLRKKLSEIPSWKVFTVHNHSLDSPSFKPKDVPAFLKSVLRAARRQPWDISMCWELEGSAVYCCFAFRDLPKYLTSRVAYLVYFPDFPLLAIHSVTKKVFNLLVDCLKAVLPDWSIEAEDVPQTDLPSIFHFCLTRLGLTIRSSMMDMPALLKLRLREYEDSELGPSVQEPGTRSKRKQEVADFFGPDQLPVLKWHKRELVDDNESVTTSVAIKSEHVLEDLRQLYIQGHLRKVDKHLEQAFQGREVVKLRKRHRRF